MPNGGSDCCATCWFNAKNKGEAGYAHTNDPEPHFCTIRNLPIEDAFYTYCANHPHRLPNKMNIPIGPVFTGESDGRREIWVASPDSEEIRQKLLEFLSKILEQPGGEYPIGIYLDDMVIWQLGEFREGRAVNDLRRIAAFDPEAESSDVFKRTRHKTVALARVALDKISGDRQ